MNNWQKKFTKATKSCKGKKKFRACVKKKLK